MWMQTDGVWGSCHLKTGHPSSSFLWLDVSYWLRAQLKLLTRKPIWGLSSMLVSKSQPSFSAAVARMGIAKEPGRRCMVFYLSVASEDTQHHFQHILQVEVVPRMFRLKQRRVTEFADGFKFFFQIVMHQHTAPSKIGLHSPSCVLSKSAVDNARRVHS